MTDASGQVKFTTIYPACYSGRYPHIHFEIYPGLSSATTHYKQRARFAAGDAAGYLPDRV